MNNVKEKWTRDMNRWFIEDKQFASVYVQMRSASLYMGTN